MPYLTVGQENSTGVKLYYEAIDDSRLVLVPGAPHGLNVTHVQTFNAEILAFLRG